MQAKRSKQDLELAIRSAIASPCSANLQQLLNELDALLLQIPPQLHLKLAGDFLAQLTDVLLARADLLLAEWEEKHNPVHTEPVLTAAMLQEVLRQTMALELEEVLAASPFGQSPSLASDSIIGTVAKNNLLMFLEQLDQEQIKQASIAIAHDEDITAWVEAIGHWRQEHRFQTVSLLELQRSLQMPLVKIWLALLQGGFSIEQRGEFYQTDSIWIAGDHGTQ